MYNSIIKEESEMKKWIHVFMFLLLIVPALSFSWKPTAHQYVANVVIDDAADGKVYIPPYGEFRIDPKYNSIKSFKQFTLAGAIGPDGFPDMLTGQSVIHPTDTDAWLSFLRSRAGQFNRKEVWAFYVGYLIHCASDMWAHDWVNYYSGGPFPGMPEFKANLRKALANIEIHIAIENDFEAKIKSKNPRMPHNIDIPIDYLYDVFINSKNVRFTRSGKVFKVELPSLFQELVDLYWKKRDAPRSASWLNARYKYNSLWFSDLKRGLKQWIITNKMIMKDVIEKNKGMFDVIKKRWSDWAFKHLLNMFGVPDAVAGTMNAFRSVKAAGDKIFKKTGLNKIIKKIDDIKKKFYNWMLKKYLGADYKTLKRIYMGKLNKKLLGNKYQQLMKEMKTIPKLSEWRNKNNYTRLKTSVNGALYNSIISSKLTMLSPSSLKKLATKMGITLPNRSNLFVPQGIYSIDGSGGFKLGLYAKFFNKLKADGALAAAKTLNKIIPQPKANKTAFIKHIIKRMMIEVKTGSHVGAGTDSDIHFGMLIGGIRKEWKLDKKAIMQYNDFERKDNDPYIKTFSENNFLVKNIKQIWIRMGNQKGIGTDWKCKSIKITINGKQVLVASLNKWFKRKNDRWIQNVNLSPYYLNNSVQRITRKADKDPGVIDTVKDFGRDMKRIGKNAVNKVKGYLSRAGSKVWNAIKGFGTRIKHSTHSFKKCYNTCTRNYAKNAAKKINELAEKTLNMLYNELYPRVKKAIGKNSAETRNLRAKHIKIYFDQLKNLMNAQYRKVKDNQKVRKFFTKKSSKNKGERRYESMIQANWNAFNKKLNQKYNQLLNLR